MKTHGRQSITEAPGLAREPPEPPREPQPAGAAPGAGAPLQGGERLQRQLELPATAAGRRLDQALAAEWPQYSRARLTRWIREGCVRVDGRAARASGRVRGGERVLLDARLDPESAPRAEPMPLDIRYEDAALLVLNKPAGLVVHPGAGRREHTLVNALLAHDAALAQLPRAGLVHRLDKDTSGLLIVARTLEAHRRLVQALAAREITREYLAVCSGRLTGGGRIERPIGRHRRLRTRMAVRGDGRAAVTHYRIERRFRAHTLLRVRLETGRTHQIRVHLAHIGFPVLGDPQYGGRPRPLRGASAALAAALSGLKRQALHAERLRFAHPLSGELLSVEAPLPADLQTLCELLRADARARRSDAAGTAAHAPRGRRA